ncbi:hypothetical protein MNQ95_04555 [Pseudoxanthomonas daejeonensis]|uniref:hypothetical protein n=1 Tax=Pseudoxanthomonas daejeonensis TaxID=266062 RepID=UPI001F5442DD|nr:hypothetical protein [Pseudoxanthomonas daejeonensis]UNK58376.1 hypothetical protein MNQ95_04555 [Pseudoxanthomonas daejeonensis]
MGEITVDFVAKDPWQMVLVEEGPWHDVSLKLTKLQQRLYSCLDAAIDGQLAEQFPESRGKPVTLRVDCYGVPREEMEEFFGRFSSSALQLPDYKASLEASPHVSGIQFAINFS